MKKNNNIGIIIFIAVIAIYVFLPLLSTIGGKISSTVSKTFSGKNIHILSSNDNKDLEPSIRDYAKKEGIKVDLHIWEI